MLNEKVVRINNLTSELKSAKDRDVIGLPTCSSMNDIFVLLNND